uniref:Mannosyltransferase n=1 Tax=Daphnia galeata TaxID=27404 RepID=A0A8J2RNS2_9CRUS|nr:unnamed protein product [Daphnia galeata]
MTHFVYRFIFVLCNHFLLHATHQRSNLDTFYTAFLLAKTTTYFYKLLLKDLHEMVKHCRIVLVVLFAVIGFDSWWYGKMTLVPLQFLLFNIVNDFSKFYGEHSWHWYFTNALPSLMGPTLFPLVLSFTSKQSWNFNGNNRVLIVQLSVVLYILCHSLVGHKEIRFLTPIVPLLNLLSALKLPSLRWRRIFLILFFTWNIPMMWYLSMRHQRGVLDATNFLRALISSEDRVLYLMPCHSTPLYSHLHVNATLQFLTCPPNLHKMKNYVDEADKFYENPSNWFMANPSSLFAHYLIIFDVLLDSVSAQLDSNGFYLIGNFFHADIVQGRVGRRVLFTVLSYSKMHSASIAHNLECLTKRHMPNIQLQLGLIVGATNDLLHYIPLFFIHFNKTIKITCCKRELSSI